jgi:hypothetical protein
VRQPSMFPLSSDSRSDPTCWSPVSPKSPPRALPCSSRHRSLADSGSALRQGPPSGSPQAAPPPRFLCPLFLSDTVISMLLAMVLPTTATALTPQQRDARAKRWPTRLGEPSWSSSAVQRLAPSSLPRNRLASVSR